MKKTILAAALTMIFAASASAQQPAESRYQSYVEVNGTAEREVEPNEIYLSITINEVESKGRIPVEEQERKMIASLRSLGIDVKSQLAVADMSSSKFRKQAATVKNYQLKLTEPAQVAEVYYALQEQGINNISIARLTRSDLQELRAQVRVEAIKNAQANARQLAEAIGQSIGKAFYIQYYNVPDGPVMLRAANAKMMDFAAEESASAASQPLEFKKIRLTASVSTKFVLE